MTAQKIENPAQATVGGTVYAVGNLVHVDPNTLLMTRNIREAKPNADLVASVRDLGVIEAITAVLTDEGGLLVRFGHRRTLAAIEAKRETVPVLIASIDSEDKEAEILRIIAQRDENTHRENLTASEDAAAVAQLALLGLSAAQIAKQARIKREVVDTALVVTGSATARENMEVHDLTLEQSAALVEFEDDGEAVIALVNAAKSGQFNHKAQALRDERAFAAKAAALTTALTEAGVTVIEEPYHADKATKRLGDLRVSETDKTRLSSDEVDHTSCPGHVAWIGSTWTDLDAEGNEPVWPEEPDLDEPEDETDAAAIEAYDLAWATHDAERAKVRASIRRTHVPVVVYGCQKFATHGHVDYYSYGYSSGASKPKAADMTEAEREAAKAARKLVIDNNKAWAAAQPVRREWLATFAKAKTAPKGAAAFIATAISLDAEVLSTRGGNTIAAALLGKKESTGYGRTDLSPAKSTTEQRSLMLALVQVLAGYEDEALNDATWRKDNTKSAAGRYLRFLAANGYTLADVETYTISSKTA